MGIIVAAADAPAGHERAGADRAQVTPVLARTTTSRWWIILSCHARHRAGHDVRRVADRQDDGLGHHPPAARRRVLRRNRRRHHHHRRHASAASRSPPPTPSPASILGVGTTKGVRSVRWIWGQRIVMAWVLTLPCAAFMAAVTYFVVTHMGIGVTLGLIVVGCLAVYLYKRRHDQLMADSDAVVSSRPIPFAPRRAPSASRGFSCFAYNLCSELDYNSQSPPAFYALDFNAFNRILIMLLPLAFQMPGFGEMLLLAGLGLLFFGSVCLKWAEASARESSNSKRESRESKTTSTWLPAPRNSSDNFRRSRRCRCSSNPCSNRRCNNRVRRRIDSIRTPENRSSPTNPPNRFRPHNNFVASRNGLCG